MRRLWRRIRYRMSDEELLELDRRRSIAVIRETFAMFGHPLDELTDEEIEEGVAGWQEATARVGVTMAEASAAFASIGEALRDAEAAT